MSRVDRQLHHPEPLPNELRLVPKVNDYLIRLVDREKHHPINYRINGQIHNYKQNNSFPTKQGFMLHFDFARAHSLCAKTEDIFQLECDATIDQPRSCLRPSMICSLFKGFILLRRSERPFGRAFTSELSARCESQFDTLSAFNSSR